MKVGFPNRSIQRLFNTHSLLEHRFGARLARKIAGRLAVLEAADSLAVLPQGPPIGFRRELSSANLFGVDLPEGRRLTFTAGPDAPAVEDLSEIEEITVIEIV